MTAAGSGAAIAGQLGPRACHPSPDYSPAVVWRVGGSGV